MKQEIIEIKEFMKKNKITYDMLSQKSGIPISTLNYIFTGRTASPRMDTIASIQAALGIKKETLFTDEDRRKGFIGNKISVEITPDEDDFLYLYKQIGLSLGEAGQKAFKEMGETILKMNQKK